MHLSAMPSLLRFLRGGVANSISSRGETFSLEPIVEFDQPIARIISREFDVHYAE
jgi:hypothetical protein